MTGRAWASRGSESPCLRAALTTGRALFAARKFACGFAVAFAAGGLACVQAVAGWNVAALEREYPALAAWSGHRLGDATPYFAPMPDGEGITLFLCRWRTDREIATSLPPDATVQERAALRAALAAWQDAGLGVRFVEVPQESARLEIRFVAEAERPQWLRPAGSAVTRADCALPAGRIGVTRGIPLAAQLVSARVTLHRYNIDVLGRPVPLAREELAGSLLHELGHALGYPGHAAVGSSVMVKSVDRVRRLGRQLMAENAADFRASTLGALYAVPTGTVVGQLALPAERMAALTRLGEIAERAGWGGPFVRVGDRWAEFWWLDDSGRVAGFVIPAIERGWGPKLRFIPTPAAREHLARRGAGSLQ